MNFANFVYLHFLYYTFPHSGINFACVIQNIQNSQNSQDYISHSLKHFSTKIHNFTKLRMLFPAVLINFQNSKFCLIGSGSIRTLNPENQYGGDCFKIPLGEYIVRVIQCYSDQWLHHDQQISTVPHTVHYLLRQEAFSLRFQLCRSPEVSTWSIHNIYFAVLYKNLVCIDLLKHSNQDLTG